jgi:glucose/mannose-6-phosphate isomerase
MDTYASGIANFVKQLSLKRIHFHNLQKLRRGRTPDAVVVIGMGGSGLVGTLLQKIAGYARVLVPLISWKDFGLPSIPYARNPLYLFISFSGNTKETLDGLRKALRLQNQSPIAVVAGGGKLLALAQEKKLPLATFPQGLLEPRQASGLMLYGTLGIVRALWKSVLAPDLSKLKGEEERLGKLIAQKIGTKFPLIYVPARLSHIGYCWKIQLNETAKTLAITSVIPEINHNEVVALEHHHKNIIALFIESYGDTSLTARAAGITKRVLKKRGIPCLTITLRGKTILETTVRGLVLGEWVSYDLARIKKVNPRQTNIINEIKRVGV